MRRRTGLPSDEPDLTAAYLEEKPEVIIDVGITDAQAAALISYQDEYTENTVGLYKLLHDSSSYQGTFAFSSTYSIAPNPGLIIDGLGDSALRLPISADDAATLSALGSTSPFGKGEKTIVDPTVRSSRQLDPSKLRFDNAAFSEWLQGPVLQEMSKTLGIDEDMNPSLNLYKLLIYEKGDHFKKHRDTPKEDGMIGTVVVVLPSRFEGGVVKLSHGDENMAFNFAESCRYDIGVAAWYSDVEHAVDEVTNGHRVALVYNLVVEGGSLSAGNTAVDPQLLDILKKIRLHGEPIVYSLHNKYSMNQRRLGFKGKDRYIISNLVTAIKRVGGIAFYCGDIEVKRSEYDDMDGASTGNSDDDDDDDDSEDDSEDSAVVDDDEMDLDSDGSRPRSTKKTKKNKRKDTLHIPDYSKFTNGYVSLSLSNLEQISGTYRHFAKDMGWSKKLLSFGPRISELNPFNEDEEYTGNEGTHYHRWYQTTCIVLWPTSEAQSIKEQAQEPTLSWSSIKHLTNKSTDIGTEDEERKRIERAKTIALIDRCIQNPPADPHIAEAGKILRERFQTVSRDDIEAIESKSLPELVKLVTSTVVDRTKVESTLWARRLQRLLKLKRLFPSDIQISFDKLIKDILLRRETVLSPSILKELAEAYQNSNVEKFQSLFSDVFTSHPDANLLLDLYKIIQEDSPAGKILAAIPVHSMHEYVISGIRQYFCLLATDPDFDPTPPTGLIYDAIGFYKDSGMKPHSKLKDRPKWGSIGQRLRWYAELLGDQLEPHRESLLAALVDSMNTPLCLPRLEIQQDLKWIRNLFLNGVANVLGYFTESPKLSQLDCATKLRENFIQTMMSVYSVQKPRRPDFYLPAWDSPNCEAKAGCNICGPINQFLQLNTEYQFDVQPTPENMAHYHFLYREMRPHGWGGDPNALKYEYRDKISLTYNEPYNMGNYNQAGRFAITKIESGTYIEELRFHKRDIQLRKQLFKLIAEPFDKYGRMQREVEGTFEPVDIALEDSEDDEDGIGLYTSDSSVNFHDDDDDDDDDDEGEEGEGEWEDEDDEEEAEDEDEDED